MKRSKDLSDLQDCQIIYFSARENGRLREFRSTAAAKPILTVGEHREFLELGGMVSFHMEERKIRFAIDLESVEQARLTIHPQVLRLAARVRKKP